jgi:hypothetical protein
VGWLGGAEFWNPARTNAMTNWRLVPYCGDCLAGNLLGHVHVAAQPTTGACSDTACLLTYCWFGQHSAAPAGTGPCAIASCILLDCLHGNRCATVTCVNGYIPAVNFNCFGGSNLTLDDYGYGFHLSSVQWLSPTRARLSIVEIGGRTPSAISDIHDRPFFISVFGGQLGVANPGPATIVGAPAIQRAADATNAPENSGNPTGGYAAQIDLHARVHVSPFIPGTEIDIEMHNIVPGAQGPRTVFEHGLAPGGVWLMNFGFNDEYRPQDVFRPEAAFRHDALPGQPLSIENWQTAWGLIDEETGELERCYCARMYAWNATSPWWTGVAYVCPWSPATEETLGWTMLSAYRVWCDTTSAYVNQLSFSGVPVAERYTTAPFNVRHGGNLFHVRTTSVPTEDIWYGGRALDIGHRHTRHSTITIIVGVDATIDDSFRVVSALPWWRHGQPGAANFDDGIVRTEINSPFDGEELPELILRPGAPADRPRNARFVTVEIRGGMQFDPDAFLPENLWWWSLAEHTNAFDTNGASIRFDPDISRSNPCDDNTYCLVRWVSLGAGLGYRIATVNDPIAMRLRCYDRSDYGAGS